jgi:hypothetical protein
MRKNSGGPKGKSDLSEQLDRCMVIRVPVRNRPRQDPLKGSERGDGIEFNKAIRFSVDKEDLMA